MSRVSVTTNPSPHSCCVAVSLWTHPLANWVGVGLPDAETRFDLVPVEIHVHRRQQPRPATWPVVRAPRVAGDICRRTPSSVCLHVLLLFIERSCICHAAMPRHASGSATEAAEFMCQYRHFRYVIRLRHDVVLVQEEDVLCITLVGGYQVT